MSLPTKQEIWCEHSLKQFKLFTKSFTQNNPNCRNNFINLCIKHGDRIGMIKYICWAWGVETRELHISDFELMHKFIFETTGLNIKLKISK